MATKSQQQQKAQAAARVRKKAKKNITSDAMNRIMP